MSAQTIREQLIAEIQTLSDEKLSMLLYITRALGRYSEANEGVEEYDEANDPTIGLISGPTDISERVKEILRDDIDPLSGWTQKARE